MQTERRLLVVSLVAVTCAAQAPIAEKARTILDHNCSGCHAASQLSGLDLRRRDTTLKGGKRGPAVIPGNAERSLLYQAAAHQADLKMPPGSKSPLPAEELEVLKTWIDQGAPWPATAATKQHWAFEPVRDTPPPADPAGWSDNPIDRFIAAQLREHSLKPAALADKRTLIRRASFDLTGLPPTPEEIAVFLADSSRNAFAKLVDRLLASPRYGERWGRHWMDVVRYADTAGDNADYPVPEARLYRDYIIDAFNSDKPYNEFLQEQLAGDILARQGAPEKYRERVIATGFLALSRRYATAPFELWHLTIEDTIETVGRTFMALTLRCARCHDHKFDPVTTQDYYALYGIFNSTRFPYAGSEEFQSKGTGRFGFRPLLPPDQAAPRLQPYQRKIEDLKTTIKGIEKEHPLLKILEELEKDIETKSKQVEQRRLGHEPSQQIDLLQEELAALVNKRDTARAELNKTNESGSQLPEQLKRLRAELRQAQRPGLPADVPGAYAVEDGDIADACVQLRGEPGEKGPVVKRSAPLFLNGGQPLNIPEGSSGRLELAQWLTRAGNPLTARVMVNRIWQHHFGKAIVGTPSNFGLRGDAPTHPELLDWLARRFVDSGWSIKAMHRLIMLSKTYQLASAAADSADPSNKWYSRQDRRRLEAEPIRDAMLSVSGKLDLSRPGPHPFPSIDQWNWTQHKPFKAVYDSSHRSVYLMTQRLLKHPYLALFDGPETNYSTDVRTSATVPLQALYLMNNSFVQEQARGLAQRLMDRSSDPRQRAELACELAWGRPAKSNEIQKAVDYVERYKLELARAGAAQEQLEPEAWSSYARIVLTSNEFLYVD